MGLRAQPHARPPRTPKAAQTTCDFSTCPKPRGAGKDPAPGIPAAVTPGRILRCKTGDASFQNILARPRRRACPHPATAALVGSRGHGCLVLAQTHFLAPQSLTGRGGGAASIPRWPPRSALPPRCPHAAMCCKGWSPSRGGKPPHSSSRHGAKRDGGPQLMFHHLHVLALNPALREQSSAGTGEDVFPMPAARDDSFAPSVKARRTGCCSPPGCAMPPPRPSPPPWKSRLPVGSETLVDACLLLSSRKAWGKETGGP